MLLSPLGRGQGLTDKSWERVDKPMLVAAGSETPSRRTSNPPEWRTEPYQFAKGGDKYLLWIEDMDNSYAGLAMGAAGDPETASWVSDVTAAFWDAHLKGDAKARERLRDWPIPAAAKGRFRVESKAAASASPSRVEKAKDAAGVHGDMAADYSARHGGRAVLVMVDGKIVFERYDNGFGPETATHLHSATKGFWGPVIAAMIEDGMIESFDEPAVKAKAGGEEADAAGLLEAAHPGADRGEGRRMGARRLGEPAHPERRAHDRTRVGELWPVVAARGGVGWETDRQEGADRGIGEAQQGEPRARARALAESSGGAGFACGARRAAGRQGGLDL